MFTFRFHLRLKTTPVLLHLPCGSKREEQYVEQPSAPPSTFSLHSLWASAGKVFHTSHTSFSSCVLCLNLSLQFFRRSMPLQFFSCRSSSRGGSCASPIFLMPALFTASRNVLHTDSHSSCPTPSYNVCPASTNGELPDQSTLCTRRPSDPVYQRRSR